MNLIRNYCGTQFFRDCIDITDPCYDRDVWCRMNDVKIVSGDYDCVAWENDEGRVMICGIYLGDYPDEDEMEIIGVVGVDAALCGFFNHKNDYTDDEWHTFCEMLENKAHSWIAENGFFTSSGYGDGCYEVFARPCGNGLYDALEIRFY